jgi:STE24 endopeptidase
MIAYAHIRYAVHFAAIILNITVCWFLLEMGWAAVFRDIAMRMSKHLFAQVAVALLLVSISLFVFLLPLNLFAGFWLEHHFGLSKQTLLHWFGDRGKGLLVNFLVSFIVVFLFYFLVRQFPNLWPVILGAVNVPLIIVLVYIAPIVIDPVFNKFVPMADCPLRTDIQELLAKADVKNAPILVVDKSQQTKKLNAYVTGIGGSARVVLWDNLINRMPGDEILGVVAHELGHYKLHHILWGLGIALLINAMLIPINLLFAEKFIAFLPANWHIQGLSDLAFIPVLFLVATSASFLTEPLMNGLSRVMEHQADEYALALAPNRIALAEAFVRLSEENLSEPDPNPFIEFWLYSHPSLKKRIDYALHGTSPFSDHREK